MHIRPATPDDAALLHELAAATFPLACPPDTLPASIESFIATNLSVDSFTASLSNPARLLFVGEIDAVASGYAMVVFGEPGDADVAASVTARPTAELSKCYALPAAHGTAQTTEITGDGQRVNGLKYTDRNSGESVTVGLEGVFIQIGLLPNTDWLKGTLELTRFGEIAIDAPCRTSAPGIFAAGDATTVPYEQIVIAMGEGSKAALSALDHLIRSSVDPTKATA